MYALLRTAGQEGNPQSPSPQTIGALCRLREAAALTALVLDERIFARAKEKRPAKPPFHKYSADMTRGQIWRKQRIYVMDHAFAEKTEAEEMIRRFKEFLRIASSDSPPFPYDFLIVHQGILDKMRRRLDAQTYPMLRLQMEALARHVVITSGRGRPGVEEEPVRRWVSFSALSNILLFGTKLDLADLLLSLRSEEA
jgi:hypothetical protein